MVERQSCTHRPGSDGTYDSDGEGKLSIQGPDLRIVSGAVIALAMTLNELCTNATKFGALSVPTGHIEVVWTIDQNNQRLHLTWTEQGGRAIHAPTRRNFGTRLIETLGKQLKGAVELAYAPDGFIYALDVPLSSLKPAD
jgi:two-component sensor histidine kinase